MLCSSSVACGVSFWTVVLARPILNSCVETLTLHRLSWLDEPSLGKVRLGGAPGSRQSHSSALKVKLLTGL